MRILKKLENSKTFWWLLGLSLLFFILRLPSLIEPNWYGDEGIYQVIGKAMSSNRILYTQIWDNKPPLLYVIYALFNGDQFLVRAFSLISGIVTIIAFFYLSKLLFKNLKSSIISTFIFVVLFATPLIEGNIANAENFMLLPIIAAGFLIYSYSQNTKYKILNTKYLILPAAGLLLGIAFLFKIVAVFDFAAFFIFLLIVNFPKRRFLLPLVVGFLIPVILTGLYFISQNAFSEFITAVFLSNVGYVGYGNKLLIPQGLLIIKLILLTGAVTLVFWKRKQLTKSTIFILLWFGFSFFNTYFSNRPYIHYVLVSLPSLCLLIGLLAEASKPKLKLIIALILIFSISILSNTFKFNPNKTFKYYENAISFIRGKKDIYSYRSFFDRKTPRDYEIASYLRARTEPADKIFIWGDSAQIYALSNSLPPGRYTVSYHITQYKNALSETEAALRKYSPKYIVTLNESRSFPFSLPNYVNKIVLRGSVIYERNF